MVMIPLLRVHACEPLYGAQLRIEADQPLTFSDQHSPRLSALAQAIMETLF